MRLSTVQQQTTRSLQHWARPDFADFVLSRVNPLWRLDRPVAALALKVRALCEQYGQHYSTGRLSHQFGQVVRRAALYSLPNPAVKKVTALQQRLRR